MVIGQHGSKSDCGIVDRSLDLVQVLHLFIYVVPYYWKFSDQIVCGGRGFLRLLSWALVLGIFWGHYLKGEKKKGEVISDNKRKIIRSYRYIGFFTGTQRRHFVWYLHLS